MMNKTVGTMIGGGARCALRRRVHGVLGAVGVAFVCAAAGGSERAFAQESVELFLSPSSTTVDVGQVFSMGLFVRSTTPTAVPMSGLNVIFDWDPSKLAMEGLLNNGPYEWLASGFPSGGTDFDGLNVTLADGDALYEATSQFLLPPGTAPGSGTGGLLVASFEFRALSPTPMTVIDMPLSAGQFSVTQVVSGTIPGLDILGPVSNASVTVLPEPSALGLCLVGLAVLRKRRRRGAADR